MIVAVNNHQGKATMLVKALRAAGHSIVDRGHTPAHALLIDLDIPMAYYERTIEKQVIFGAKVIMYQHGANPLLGWDGIYPASDRVTAFLTMNEGIKRVCEMYGCPHEMHVIGWHYCPMVEYSRPEYIKRILFAPWHPLQSGYLHPDRREKNAQIFNELKKMKDVELTVRMIGNDLVNGVPYVAGVEYVQANPDNSYTDIDRADLVVSPTGTFPMMALARGKPTIIYGMDLRPFDGDTDRGIKYAKSWESYRDYMHYPYHWPDRPLDELIEETRVKPDWYIDNFVGRPLDPVKFVELFESIVEGERAYA